MSRAVPGTDGRPHPAPVRPRDRRELKAAEKARAQELQRSGQWRHLWRVAGQYANVSVFDVHSVDRLHDLLSGLPLYPFLDIQVPPLATHPSAIDGHVP